MAGDAEDGVPPVKSGGAATGREVDGAPPEGNIAAQV